MKPKRPLFSERTKLVLAQLDNELPLDAKALREMIDRRIIVPAAKHAVLRKALEATLMPKESIARLYAIPFRKPEDPIEKSPSAHQTIHRRSIHTYDLPGRQFVFKGTGADNQTISFRHERTDIREREFYGGATREGIKTAIDTLETLERDYEKAKRESDPVIKWAKKHGVSELPVIKHAAVFRPLQFLVQKRTQANGKRRVEITQEQFNTLRLAEFYGEERVHAYSARRPERISEFSLSDPTKAWIRGHMKVKTIGLEAKRKLLKQFVVRGLLLLHVADKSKVGLWQDRMGSPFAPRNASMIEFFDFDTGHYNSKQQGELERKQAIEDFAETLSKFGNRLADVEIVRPWKIRGQTVTNIHTALQHIRDNNMKEAEQKLNEIVDQNLL